MVEPRLADTPEMWPSMKMWTLCLVWNAISTSRPLFTDIKRPQAYLWKVSSIGALLGTQPPCIQHEKKQTQFIHVPWNLQQA